MITTGSIVGKFEVLEKVGEGGMATVYRGRHLTLGREVAVKVLHPHLASSDKNRARFEREAKAIEVVEHPNILQIHDYSGRDAENAWIITEFIAGPTLRELLDDVGAMMPEPAALIGHALCLALDAAHAHGIVHRDLKPENVMIDKAGSVKLMDFGIARVLTDVQVTMTGALVGSPAYMSPEQALDEPIDARCDLFSLGTVLYRMVTGALPFRGNNPSVVLKAIIDGVYEDPTARVPSLDPSLATIIVRCLARDRDARYPSARAVADALAGYLASVGIDVKEPGPWAVARYLDDAEGYEARLAETLIGVLTARGRGEAERGDPASALRTLNRVLALDEDNTEVVEVIESMRRPLVPPPPPRRGVAGLVVVTGTILALAMGALWVRTDGFTRRDGAPGASEELPALPLLPRLPVHRAEVAPALPAPTPTPEPAPTPTPTPRLGPRELERELARAPQLAPVRPEPTPQPPAEPVAAVAPPCEGPNSLSIPKVDIQKVRIDGGAEQYPPLTVRLTAGTHEIEVVETQYHFAQTLQVRVCGNERPVQPRIEPLYKPSRVVLEGFPPEATLTLDGRAVGTLAERAVLTLEENRTYSVEVWLDDAPIAQHSVTRGLAAGDLHPGQSKTLSRSR